MTVYARPLPSNPYNVLHEKDWHDAYQQCIQIQPLDALDDKELSADRKDVVFPRTLGHLILQAPHPEGRDYVSREILRCEGDLERLYKFAEIFVLDVQDIFKNQCSTPEVDEGIPDYGEHPVDYFSRAPQKYPKDHLSAKISALNRDEFRCMLTTAHDFYHYMTMLRFKIKESELGGLASCPTYACHIIPPPLNQTPGSLGRGWEFMLNYCSLSLDELNVANHSLTNIVTLVGYVGGSFRQLYTWFEHRDHNTYEYCSWQPDALTGPGIPQYVEFSSGGEFPAPDPRYFKLHAAICRAAQFSDAWQYKADRDWEIMEATSDEEAEIGTSG